MAATNKSLQVLIAAVVVGIGMIFFVVYLLQGWANTKIVDLPSEHWILYLLLVGGALASYFWPPTGPKLGEPMWMYYELMAFNGLLFLVAAVGGSEWNGLRLLMLTGAVLCLALAAPQLVRKYALRRR